MELNDRRSFTDRSRRPRWPTLVLVGLLHIAALFALARAFAPELFALPVEGARGAGVLRGRGTGGAVTSRGVARLPSSAAAPSSARAGSGLGFVSGGGGV